MKCPVCGHENEEHYRFCGACGVSLMALQVTQVAEIDQKSLVSANLSDLLAPGTVLKKTYEIVEVIGEGGAGTVYRARHLTLGNDVAIKILFGQLERIPSVRSRFLEEARIQANLRHPNIVLVTDVVEDSSLVAMVMEFVEGKTLNEFIRTLKGPVPLMLSVKLMIPTLDAMGYAHGNGIIHRDLKPHNIMLTRSGGRPEPKVMDFGIAKMLGGPDVRTMTGALMGTLHYMAPEQFRDAKSIDHRADIYSLAITLYEMTTGRVPFESDSDFVIVKAHMEVDPPSPRTLNPALSENMEKVILKGLEKNPRDRFQTCEEFKTALERLRDGADPFAEDKREKTSDDGLRFFTPPPMPAVTVKPRRSKHQRVDTYVALAALESASGMRQLPATPSERQRKRPNFATPTPIFVEPERRQTDRKWWIVPLVIAVVVGLSVVLIVLLQQPSKTETTTTHRTRPQTESQPAITNIMLDVLQEVEADSELTLKEQVDNCRRIAALPAKVDLDDLRAVAELIVLIDDNEERCQRAIEASTADDDPYKQFMGELLVDGLMVDRKMLHAYHEKVLPDGKPCHYINAMTIQLETILAKPDRFLRGTTMDVKEYMKDEIERRRKEFVRRLERITEDFPECF